MPYQIKDSMRSQLSVIYEFVKILSYVYLFLFSIDLMGAGFKLSGSGFTTKMMQTTSNPFIGLIIGIVTTSIVQSSSLTTSIVVAMVGAGTLTLTNAVPIIMGANIGTTVTNTIVSFGYLNRKGEFERAFGTGIVHDIFNISATLILFPLELYTGILSKSALFLSSVFVGVGGFKIISPLVIIINPLVEIIIKIIGNHIVIIIGSLILLFVALGKIVKIMHGIVIHKVEGILNKYFFRNNLVSFLVGLILTSIIQSSSITTSIIVPLVGAGILTIEQIYPYTLGANVGTTVTAILAALTIGIEASMAIAFCHMLFNVYGILIFYPLKFFPIWTAKTIARLVARSKKNFFIFLALYITLHIIPIILVFIH